MLKIFYYLTIDDTVYVNLFNNTLQRIKDDTTKEEEVDELVSSILGKYGRIHISNIYIIGMVVGLALVNSLFVIPLINLYISPDTNFFTKLKIISIIRISYGQASIKYSTESKSKRPVYKIQSNAVTGPV